MVTLTSSEFRKTYASLTEPTVVTVNGHAIGEWTPLRYTKLEDVEDVRKVGREAGVSAGEGSQAFTDFGRSFNTRPFTPVPKHGK